MTIPQGTLNWLLEEENPSVRYLTLQFLKKSSDKNSELTRAEQGAYQKGLIGTVLKAMHPDGYWTRPGAGYNPKYFSSVWSLILLSQLGANVSKDERIQRACRYYLDHAYCSGGYLGYNGTPSGAVDCLQGNMCAALKEMEYHDQRLDDAYEWLAKSVTGDGVGKYYSVKCGPNFACGINNKQPCGWGAVKVMLALSKVPKSERTAQMNKAIEMGVSFLFSCDPMDATYPTRTGSKPSRDWWKFGFPVFYVTDLLQNAEVLVSFGYGHDPRLGRALEFIKQKQNTEGKWLLEYDYPDKTWVDVGTKWKPNKYVTLRALKVLSSN